MPSKPKTRKPRSVRETNTIYRITTRPSLTPVEAEGLEEFRARLDEILHGRELKSLILYGSRARGEMHPGSDIDLLIVHDSPRQVKDEILDAASEIELQLSERQDIDLQPLVRTVSELAQESALGMPLLHNIAREGIILEGEPIMPEKMDRKYWAAIYIEDAKQQLASAKLLLANGDIRRPIAMAFSIYEDAARAVLIAKGIAPKSHEGTQNLFGLHFVETSLIPKHFAVHFTRMYKDRNDATYAKQKNFDKEDAELALERAEELLTMAENLLPSLLEKEPWNYSD